MSETLFRSEEACLQAFLEPQLICSAVRSGRGQEGKACRIEDLGAPSKRKDVLEGTLRYKGTWPFVDKYRPSRPTSGYTAPSRWTIEEICKTFISAAASWVVHIAVDDRKHM